MGLEEGEVQKQPAFVGEGEFSGMNLKCSHFIKLIAQLFTKETFPLKILSLDA